MTTIREWMNNKTILITGGAGFLGKVLTEKLLRSCPGVKRIYLIIRSKGGQNPQERWADIINDPLFEKLLANAPDIVDRKIIVLEGDVSLINLGLSEDTIKELIDTVNIIFHSAATVRFNDPLHKAFLVNSRGTLEMCKLASKMNHLEVFVHVSTTFCNHNLMRKYYEEKIYEPCQDWRTILQLIEVGNPSVVNTLSYKILQNHPNTYTFTKSLSEKIVEEYSCKVPTVIVRPPVVTGILKEPIPGWTDNLNGAFGVSPAVFKGVMRVMKGIKTCVLDCVSVDIVINAVLVCSWDKATSKNKELSIYNCAYPDILPISIEELMDYGKHWNETVCTLDNEIWYPFLLLATNDLYLHTLFYLLQVIPAIFVDSILFLMKKKPRMIKINIKLCQVIKLSEAFTMKEVVFDNTRYKALWDKVTGDDAEVFPVRPPADINPKEAIRIMHTGVKKYIFKENIENNEYHRLKLKRLYYLDRFARGILISALFAWKYKLINETIRVYVL